MLFIHTTGTHQLYEPWRGAFIFYVRFDTYFGICGYPPPRWKGTQMKDGHDTARKRRAYEGASVGDCWEGFTKSVYRTFMAYHHMAQRPALGGKITALIHSIFTFQTARSRVMLHLTSDIGFIYLLPYNNNILIRP